MSSVKDTYFIMAESGSIKIGLAKDVRKRKTEHQISNHEELVVLGSFDSESEAVLKIIYKPFKLRGEWYRPNVVILESMTELLGYVPKVNEAFMRRLRETKFVDEYYRDRSWSEMGRKSQENINQRYTNDRLTVTEAARRMNVSTKTLYRWEAQKKLVPQHTAAGRRWYAEGQIAAFLPTEGAPEKRKKQTTCEVCVIASPKAAPQSVKPSPSPVQKKITDPKDPEYVPDDSDDGPVEEQEL